MVLLALGPGAAGVTNRLTPINFNHLNDLRHARANLFSSGCNFD
jgi:hypothetical protein